MITTHSQQQFVLEKAIENYEHGYYNDAAADLLHLIENGRKSGALNPHLLEFLGVVYTSLGKYEEAEGLFDEASIILKKCDPLESIDSTVKLLNTRAGLYHQWGQYDKAIEMYRQALLELRVSSSREANLNAEVHISANLADILIRMGRFTEAEELISSSRKLNLTVGDTEAEIGLDHNYACLLLANGKAKEAEELLERILQDIHSSHRDLPVILTSLAMAQTRLSKYDRAESIYRRVLAMNERMLGRRHPGVANTCNLLAQLYLFQNKHREAELMCNRALAILSQTLGSDHHFGAEVLMNLVSARVGQGIYTEIEALQHWVFSIVEGTFGVGTRLHYYIHHRVAISYHQRRQYKEAEAFYLSSLESSKVLYGENHPQTAVVMTNLAHCYFHMCNHKAADRWSEIAATVFTQIHDQTMEPAMLEVMGTLAELRFIYKDYRSAEILYKRAGELMASDETRALPSNPLAYHSTSTGASLEKHNAA